jgi:hypothetical protein
MPSAVNSYAAIAQCDLWFPPITLPVGFGQARKPTQLPVLTMVTGYVRRLSGGRRDDERDVVVGDQTSHDGSGQAATC